jgi:hypothetical protein
LTSVDGQHGVRESHAVDDGHVLPDAHGSGLMNAVKEQKLQALKDPFQLCRNEESGATQLRAPVPLAPETD